MQEHEICQNCQDRQLSEHGYVNYWYCENRCEIGKKDHEKENGTAWDMMDKQSVRYKQAAIDGD